MPDGRPGLATMTCDNRQMVSAINAARRECGAPHSVLESG